MSIRYISETKLMLSKQGEQQRNEEARKPTSGWKAGDIGKGLTGAKVLSSRIMRTKRNR